MTALTLESLDSRQPANPPRRLYTLEKFAERHSSFLTLGALTGQVWRSKPRQSSRGEIPGNGLEECGAIVRVNGRVLIDEARYFEWVDEQQAERRSEP
jgi:hypothetical protein